VCNELINLARPPLELDLSPLTQMLEQQSTLISSLANATQQNRGHQNDHLIPLLEGQQAVLEKLTTVESTQVEVTDRLTQFDNQQSEVVGELRSQIEEITAEKNELADRAHQLEIEVLESRHARENVQKEAGEDRDKLEIAQSRNAALEQHLQALIKEKQSLAREIEEDQKTRQEEALRYEKAQVDFNAKQDELLAEKRRNETLAEVIRSQSSELAELRHSTSRFQETLVDRLSRIEEGVQGSSDHSAELAKWRAQNERLQQEVDSLKEQVSYRNTDTADVQRLLAQQERFAEEAKSKATLRELEDLRQELSSERELRKNAEEKAAIAEEALQKESVLRFQAQMVAKERSHHANMQEVSIFSPFFHVKR
jgi:chromosome segregation ATPase